jgi:hypothetical protein
MEGLISVANEHLKFKFAIWAHPSLTFVTPMPMSHSVTI